MTDAVARMTLPQTQHELPAFAVKLRGEHVLQLTVIIEREADILRLRANRQ